MARAQGKDRGLFERPKGSGVWWIRYSDREGQEHREKVGPKSEARAAYEKRKTEVRLEKFDPGRAGRARAWTVAKMMAHYRKLRGHLRRQEDDQRYADLWTARFGSRELDQVKPSDIERWRAEQIQEGKLKPASINRATQYLKAYFNLAIRDGHCQRNPVAATKTLPEENQRLRYLTEAEAERVFSHLNPEARKMVELSLATGLRKSAQFLLRLEDLDFQAGVYRIVMRKGGVTRPRWMPMSDKARALFEEFTAKARAVNSPWLFPSPKDPSRHRHPSSFSHNVFKRACVKAGLPDVRWHDLRHCVGSWLAMQGVDLAIIRDVLGHSSVRMSERYAALSPRAARTALNALKPPTDGHRVVS